MNKGILGKITSFIKNKFYNESGGYNPTKEKCIDGFKEVLDKLEVLPELKYDLVREFEKNLVISSKINESYVSNMIWLTIISYIENSTIYNNQSLGDKLVFMGSPGVGKTTLIVSYLKMHNISRSKIICSPSSLEIMSQYSDTIADGSMPNVIVETSDYEIASSYAHDMNFKFIYCVDMSQDLSTVYSDFAQISKQGISIDYIVLTKRDASTSCSTVMNVPYITKKRIIYFTSEEISSSNRSLGFGTDAILILAKTVYIST